MKKRVLSLVMSTAMVASVLTACGSSAEAPATDNNAAATETKTEAAAATTEALQQRKLLITVQVKLRFGLLRMFRHLPRIRLRHSRMQIPSMPDTQ